MSQRGQYKRYNVVADSELPRRSSYRKRRRLVTEINEQLAHPNIVGDIQIHEEHVAEAPTVNLLAENIMQNEVPDEDNELESESDQDVAEIDRNQVHNHDSSSDNEVELNNDMDGDNKILNMAEGNEPLYPGSRVTKAESMLLVVSYILRHNVTDEALKDLLNTYTLLLPEAFPGNTKYKFYKAFDTGVSEVHYYCYNCKFYMGRDKTRRQCESCREAFNGEESLKNGNFFLYIPLKGQLIDMLQNPKIHNHLTNRDLNAVLRNDNICDVPSAELYKELIRNNNLSPNDMSLTWNTDGVSVFKSSNCSIWPIQCMINELPPHMRFNNVLMTGLWFGNEKPVMNTFLKPFVDECIDLEENGFLFENEPVPRKVFSLVCCADTPARAIVRNCKQFNGHYGCDWCLHPGETVVRDRGPPMRYYPFRGEVALRTHRQQAEFALRAEETQEAFMGVKGVSIIQSLPTFDTVNGFTAEYMHSVCQGVMRQLCNLWLDSGNHEHPYYIGRQLTDLDERLKSISPPSEVTRSPRPLSVRKFWKASEWRSFLFCGLVVLRGILPDIYLKHFFLLSYGVFNLLGDNVKEEIRLRAEACLLKFVVKMEELYGISACSFNVHQLTHLADGVRYCGPLWSTSAFAFEANNHMLLQMFDGTQYVPQQICDTFMLARKLPKLSRECFTADTTPEVRHLFMKLIGEHLPGKNTHILDDNLSGIGRGRNVMLSVMQVAAVMRLLGADINNRAATMYTKFVANKMLYTSKSYTRSKRHNDFTVIINHPDSKYATILGLYTIKPHCQCNNVELQYCRCRVFKIVLVNPLDCTNVPMYIDADFGAQSHFIAKVTDSADIIALWPESLKNKCICFKLRNRKFICELPCRLYGD